MWTQRDQFTSTPLPLDDQKLIEEQHHRRLANNMFYNDKMSKQSSANDSVIPTGTIVYINAERNKSQSRPRYIVASQDGPWYLIKKFSGNQLRNHSYKVHRNQLSFIPVPDASSPPEPNHVLYDNDYEADDNVLPNVDTTSNTPSEVATNMPSDITTYTPAVYLPPAALTDPAPSDPAINTPNTQQRIPDSDLVVRSRPKRQTRLPTRFEDFDMS